MRFQCSHCDQIVAVNDEDMGSMVSCGHCGEAENVPDQKFGPRVVISDFVIIEEIGLGRMATVYLAHQITLDRKVALKILSSELADDSDFIMDFFREARAAGRLNHPNIVQAYAVDEEDGTYFLAMEHIEGKNLKQILEEQGQLPLDYCLMLLHQIAEALSFIWKGHKICHENIKPENILITKTNAAKLSDLGLSKANRRKETSTNYISPEKILGSKIDIRSDLYSLGITFYEILAGCLPFEADSRTELRNMQLKATPPDIRKFRSDVPSSYTRIIDKLLAKHPDDRYLTPDELINDIKLARSVKNEKKNKAAAAVRAQQKQEFENKNLKKIKTLNGLLTFSVVLNVIMILIVLMIVTGKAPVQVPKDTAPPDQITRYHQIAVDMNLDSLSPERSATLLEEVNQFINQYPESPHLPVVRHWKNILEEITIRSKRFELHNNELEEKEGEDALNDLVNNKGKKQKKPPKKKQK